VRRPKANNIPLINTGNRQRFRACSPAANHSLHSDHSSGDSQSRPGFAILGSPIVQCVLQLQHDGRAFFAGYQLLAFSQKVQLCFLLFKKRNAQDGYGQDSQD
jgi:hypothetical protein